jgi:hypothetical protein
MLRQKLLLGVALALVVAFVVALRVACAPEPARSLVAKESLPHAAPPGGPCWAMDERWLELHAPCEGPAEVRFPIEHLDVKRGAFSDDVETAPLALTKERPWHQRAYVDVRWERAERVARR